MGCSRVSFPWYLWSHLGCLSLITPHLLRGLLMPLSALEVSMAGGKGNILLEDSFIFSNANFFWVEVGHWRGDRVRASSPGYRIPLPW